MNHLTIQIGRSRSKKFKLRLQPKKPRIWPALSLGTFCPWAVLSVHLSNNGLVALVAGTIVKHCLQTLSASAGTSVPPYGHWPGVNHLGMHRTYYAVLVSCLVSSHTESMHGITIHRYTQWEQLITGKVKFSPLHLEIEFLRFILVKLFVFKAILWFWYRFFKSTKHIPNETILCCLNIN